MSKLFNLYKSLKQQDDKTLYLFKSGIFYIFIDNDAKIVNTLLNLKLTNLNTEVVKCGFPVNSLSKYLKLLKLSNYNIKIVDTISNTSCNIKDFSINTDNLSLLKKISSVNQDNLSIKEAFDFISDIKQKAKEILQGEN